MNDAMRLAGYCAAHAIWSISDGPALIPMAGCRLVDGSQELHRFLDEEHLERAVAEGRRFLSDNPRGASSAVLIYDGYIELDKGRVDALFLDIRDYPGGSISMAIPYRPLQQAKRPMQGKPAHSFAVYRPKFLDLGPFGEQALGELAGAFFDGAESHVQGFAVWEACLDESI